MLAVLCILTLAQDPQVFPPKADPRMILDGRVIPARQRNAERQARRIREHILGLLKHGNLRLTVEEIELLVAYNNAVVPAAFLGDQQAKKKLAEAEQKMRKGVSKRVLEAVLDLVQPRAAGRSP